MPLVAYVRTTHTEPGVNPEAPTQKAPTPPLAPVRVYWSTLRGRLTDLDGCARRLRGDAIAARPRGWTERGWLTELGRVLTRSGPWEAWLWAAQQTPRAIAA